MDRNQAKVCRDLLNKAVQDNPALEGYTVEVQNGTFNDSEITFKVMMRQEGAKSAALKDAEMMAELNGFKMENAKGDKIVAFKSRSPKFPWIVEKATGGRYKYTETHMKVEGFLIGVDA